MTLSTTSRRPGALAVFGAAGAMLLTIAACSNGDTIDNEAEQAGIAANDEAVPPAADTARLARDVRVGAAEADFGQCDAVGRVGGLPGGEDNFLAVREAPTTRARELARLDPGARVYLCDRNESGKWFGVVYRSSGSLPEGNGCALHAAAKGAYDGPCRSGWVSARYVMRERYITENGEEMPPQASEQEAAGAAYAANSPLPGEQPVENDRSHYFCEIFEGFITDAAARRRRAQQGIKKGYYLSDVFEAPKGQSEELERKYKEYGLKRFDYDHIASLRSPRCFEFGGIDEARQEHRTYRTDYGNSKYFEVVPTFWRGQ